MATDRLARRDRDPVFHEYPDCTSCDQEAIDGAAHRPEVRRWFRPLMAWFSYSETRDGFEWLALDALHIEALDPRTPETVAVALYDCGAVDGDLPEWRCREIAAAVIAEVEAPDVRNGDHPADGDSETEGRVVRYFRHPEVDGSKVHERCGHTWHDHGWIDTLEGGGNVCPGDWIIRGVKGEFYPCKPDIFDATYEPADGD